MNQEQKFNIGDIVFKFELDYFDNSYHFKKCIEKHTVTDANEKYFSLYGKLDPYFAGCNQWDIRHQSSGLQMYGNTKMYHAEKDKDEIKILIEKTILKYDSFTKENDQKRVSELKEIIKNATSEIKQIELGNGSWKRGFSTHSNKDYKEMVLKFIKSVFNYEN